MDDRNVMLRIPEALHRDVILKCHDGRLNINSVVIGLLSKWAQGKIVMKDGFFESIRDSRRARKNKEVR